MLKVTLPGIAVETTAVGFGCGSLTGAGTAQASLRLLDEALANGVTHFDVAPSYGYGASEGLLGEFAAGKRDKITITTKYGIQVSGGGGMAQRQGVVSLAKKMVKAFPPLKRMLQKRAAAMFKPASFAPADVQAGLEASLRKLRTDYLDFYLLHEADLLAAQREDLIAWLEQQVKGGKIRACGVGSELPRIGMDASKLPGLLQVMQFHSSVQKPQVREIQHREGRIFVTHGSLRVMPTLKAALESRPAEFKQLRELLGGEPWALLPSALLQLAREENPTGLVIFSTSKATHVGETLGPLREKPLAASSLAEVAGVLKGILG